ncbi:MAG: LemA family protein [Pseudomonadota bacterium]
MNDDSTPGRAGFNWKLGCLLPVGILLIIALIAGLWFVRMYNKGVTYDEQVKEGWSEVENQLKRRLDLLDNLVETVKGYAKHEKEVFTHLADARKAYFSAAKGGSMTDKIKAASGLDGALSRLLLLKEKYPDLKANQSFLKLQDSIEGTENRIAVARKRYNEAARALNAYRRSFFGRFFAGMTDLEEAPYYELDEAEKEATKKPPKVGF